MKKTEIELLERAYNKHHQNKLQGRRILLSDILPILNELPSLFKVSKIGESFLKNDIYSVSLGSGDVDVFVWTQMHGNESTGTKALFDFFEFMKGQHEFSDVCQNILKKCTITCVPILNPDGAIAYTRVNAQGVDLNRDVIDKTAGESVILQDLLKKLNPKYCFNLHDQRTIFSVGADNNPATISFLAPSIDEERTLTEGRKQTMEVIVGMNNLLQNYIPNQVGRYTDEFYPTATGDNFQKMGHNTILIESGHFKDDYMREKTRKYTFMALFQGLSYVSKCDSSYNYEEYFEIPNNEKQYLDILLKDVTFEGEQVDVGVLFKETLINEALHFVNYIEKVGDLSNYNANKVLSESNLNFASSTELLNWLEYNII